MDEQPDPDELRQRAQQYEELSILLTEIRASLDTIQDSEIVDEQTQHRVAFLKEILSMIQHGQDWDYAAHYARYQAEKIERQDND